MKISVVIPCRNAANVLAAQLDALESQSVPPFEIIVADNGSTDDSRVVAAEFGDRLPRFQIVDASGLPGASHARNIGARHATGTHIAFCDADDVVSPGWIEAIAAALVRSDFVASRFDHQALNQRVRSAAQVSELQHFRTPFLPFAGGCGLAIRKSVHDLVNGFDESLVALEDADYCIRVQLAGTELTFESDAVIHIRAPNGSGHGFLESRVATYNKAHAWSYGMAELFLRYKGRGMVMRGVPIRLVLMVPLVTQFVFTGAKHQPLWRIGWHAGAVHRLLEHRWQRLLRRPSPEPSVPDPAVAKV